jgi:hypothetical protein
MTAIAFVGDSFCSAYSLSEWKARRCTQHQIGTNEPVWTTIVAKTNHYTLYPYGFGGKSWWYSRQRFIEDLERIPKNIFADNLEVIVFCHTNYGRINNSWNRELSNTDTTSPEAENYYRYIFDSEFNKWAQQQWFKEINDRWGHLKTIHFHCFPESVQSSHLLPGVVCTTPLVHISMGELQGTDREINKILVEDKRNNHLNATNNKALAEFVLANIYNYNTGTKELDPSNFDIINLNAKLWPDSGYGTKK